MKDCVCDKVVRESCVRKIVCVCKVVCVCVTKLV